MENYEYQCAQCGSNAVETKMWVNPNDMGRTEPMQFISEDEEDCWCRDCDDHRKIEYVPIKTLQT